MSCFYYPTSLSYITSKKPLLLDDTCKQKKPQSAQSKHDQALRLGLPLKSEQDEEFAQSTKKLSLPLSFKFPVPGDNYSMSQRIHQSSVSSETDNTSLITTSSTQNPRESLSTNTTEYDDLYDVSSDEGIKEERSSSKKTKAQKYLENFQSSKASSSKTISSNTQSFFGLENPAAYVATETHHLKPKIVNDLGFCGITESSAPYITHSRYSSENHGEDWAGGVQLHPDAMATLQAISQHHDITLEGFENFCELTPRHMVIPEMQQIRHHALANHHQENSNISVPTHRKSVSQLISLDIPSPKRFLVASMSPGTRHTWHFDSPSSTAAEQFYRSTSLQSPKNKEVESPLVVTQNNSSPISSVQVQESETPCNIQSTLDSVTRSCHEEIRNLGFYLNKKTSDVVDTEIDRTSFWVAIQRSMLSTTSSPVENLDDTEPDNSYKTDLSNSRDNPRPPTLQSRCSYNNDYSQIENKKFSIDPEKLENVYYCAFQYLISHSSNQDTFIQRISRYEAIQSQRVSFPATHRAQLLGKYSLSDFPLSPKARLLAYFNTDIEITSEDVRRLKRDLEDEAIRQISLATWTFMALKFLYGGHLFPTPITNYFSSLYAKECDQAQILDLGGQEVCGWAWHCAIEYPETLVYTVTPRSLQLSSSKISGPKNHRNVVVDSIIQLPFQDNQFNLISARSLYSMLKAQTEIGLDEWDACLEECFRVLKPGGYLEFDIIDSEIINPGPLGFAKGSEFSLSLKLLNFDPHPTRRWLARLERSKFVDVRRTWLFLPMGGCTNSHVTENDTMSSEAEAKSNAELSGSTIDMAPICGLIGSWAWERWLLRYKMLAGGIGESFEGIEAIILEGSKCGAGWRSLSGWARKPAHF